MKDKALAEERAIQQKIGDIRMGIGQKKGKGGHRVKLSKDEQAIAMSFAMKEAEALQLSFQDRFKNLQRRLKSHAVDVTAYKEKAEKSRLDALLEAEDKSLGLKTAKVVKKGEHAIRAAGKTVDAMAVAGAAGIAGKVVDATDKAVKDLAKKRELQAAQELIKSVDVATLLQAGEVIRATKLLTKNKNIVKNAMPAAEKIGKDTLKLTDAMVRVVPRLRAAADIASNVAVTQVKAIVKGLNDQVKALDTIKDANIKVALDNFAKATFTGSESKNLVSQVKSNVTLTVNISMDRTELLAGLSNNAPKKGVSLKLSEVATTGVS